MLRRLMEYGRRTFGLDEATGRIRDGRTRRRIPTIRMVRSLFLMVCVRIGSLNALSQARSGGFGSRWLGGDVPSADALGDVAATLSLDDLREEAYRQYQVLKRNKAIRPLPGGWLVLVLDGHESGASYLRPASLQRTIPTAKGEKIQFYYRHVAALLLHAGGQVLLDVEPQQPGEDEIAAALRLWERVEGRYPRAFEVVAGDALYMNPGFCRRVRSQGKHFVVVLKNENRDLITDARSLFPLVQPVLWEHQNVRYECWDVSDLTTWTQFGSPVRVVRSRETRSVRRQRTHEVETQTTEWLWATSLPRDRASTLAIVRIGHGRWTIENQGFNELVNEWHADHIYKNHPHAIVALLLMLFLAYNLFHALLTRNLKPALRKTYTPRFLADKIKASFHGAVTLHASARSP
jgi:hypothetical protein